MARREHGGGEVGAPTVAPTVNDVAALAHVSRQTVSNVLNAPERVRTATRERVEAAIDTLKYRPHRLARNLKARSSRLLGYAVPPSMDDDAINPVLDRFLHDLTAAARDEGYHVLLFVPDDDTVGAHLDLHATSTVDGFVLSETNYGDPRVEALAHRGVPFVAFGRTGDDAGHPWVDVDGAAGIAAAVGHLVTNGHRRIAFVGWPQGSVTGDERLAGYHRGLESAGLWADPAVVVRVANGAAEGAMAARQLLDLAEPPTAVVTTSDLLAAGVIATAHARGVPVVPTPVDDAGLAVVGFDDTAVAPFLSPALTSVRQPLEDVGRIVVRLLTARLADASAAPEGVLLSPRLIIRDSA